jgi:hypothetical protein
MIGADLGDTNGPDLTCRSEAAHVDALAFRACGERSRRPRPDARRGRRRALSDGLDAPVAGGGNRRWTIVLGSAFLAVEPTISEQFSQAERVRFHNLLKLAAETPFAGERANALAAADRMAARIGLTLAEAAADASARQRPPAATARATPPAPSAAARFTHFFHLSEAQLHADKAQRDASRQAAYERGLDAAERAPPHRPVPAFVRRPTAERRMDPFRHARNLLLETALPLREIVRLTGLSIWQVVGLKLKLRVEATRRSR